jgi:hypothetical protein
VLALGQTDGGLRLAGIGGVELVVARLPTLAVGVPVVGEISVAVALQFVAPVNPVALLAVTGLLGVTYSNS